MSVITKAIRRSKKEQKKINVLLTVKKETLGLFIKVESSDLGELVDQFYERYYKDRNKTFSYNPNPKTIINSINWNYNYQPNRLVQGDRINLNILRDYIDNNDKLSEMRALIGNVFTNEEIKTFVETFESMVIMMKKMVEKKRYTRKPKVDPILITSPQIENPYYGQSIIQHLYNQLDTSQVRPMNNTLPTDIHDPETCELCIADRRTDLRTERINAGELLNEN